MPNATVVDYLYQDFQDLIAHIDVAEVSLRETLRVNFSKSLLLAAASYFEGQVKCQILDFARSRSSGGELVLEFIRNKAIERQYHSFFVWKEVKVKSANQFFGLFGNEFRQTMTKYVAENEEYGDAILAFLEIGQQRNQLAHDNYAQYQLLKTIDEIYASYQSALVFVSTLGTHLARVSNPNEAQA